MTSFYEMITKSETDTKEIATFLAPLFQPSDVITLEGNLGVGKTTFTKGLAEGLGIQRAVTSPTFTIVKQYKGNLSLYHMDAYRLEHSDEDIGFDEYFYGDGISVVEWASFIEDYLPKERLAITITLEDMETRKVSFHPIGKKYEQIVNRLKEKYDN